MRIRSIAAGALCAVLPLSPLAAAPTPTVTVAAVLEDSSGALSVRRWEVAVTDQGDLLRRLDGMTPVLASGVEGRRQALADPRRSEQWGLSRMDVDQLRKLGTGRGVTVAVVDTGVDASHPDLQHAVLPGIDLVDAGGDGRTDPNGHGTHVAGIIAGAADGAGMEGLAPDVRILPVRVLGRDGSGDDAVIAAGILWALRNGAQVINLSLGGIERDPLLADAVDRAVSAGVVVVAAAGNSGASGEVMYPAAHPTVLAVAATGPDDKTSLFSTRGDYVDLAAPGSMILSSYPGGQYRYESGTSMAAPFVSAAAAVLLERSLTASESVARLLASAHDIDDPGTDRASGNGIVDPYAAATTGRPREGQPRPVTSPVAPVLTPLPAPRIPDLVRPTLPPMPDLIRPALPTQPSLPDPQLPSRPTLPSPSLPDAPVDGVRRLSPMTTSLELYAQRTGDLTRISVSLRTSRYPLAFREITVSVTGRGGTQRRQLRTDSQGRATYELEITAPRTAKAVWAGDSVTAGSRRTVSVTP
jgi:type VII secretion-associated serine protease mycosin